MSLCQLQRNISVRQVELVKHLKAGPKYSGLTHKKSSVPFDFEPKLPEFSAELEAPKFSEFNYQQSSFSGKIQQGKNRAAIAVDQVCRIAYLTCSYLKL